MRKACVNFAHIEHIEVCCESCMHTLEYFHKGRLVCDCKLGVFELCRKHEYAFWEINDLNAEVLAIWDTESEVRVR